MMSDKKWAHVAGPALLLAWRDKVKLTQQAAADLIGIDLASYNAFEKGRERPGLEYAVQIERATKGKIEPRHWTHDLEARPRAS
jgi:DNA-binding XRE family transcriptional regulator